MGIAARLGLKHSDLVLVRCPIVVEMGIAARLRGASNSFIEFPPQWIWLDGEHVH